MVEPAPRAQNRIDDAREIGRHPDPFPGSALSSIEYCESGLPSDHQSGRFPASKVPVHKKNDDRADHRADQTGSFARSVPAEHLSEEAGYESANDAEDGGEVTNRTVLPMHPIPACLR